MPVKSRVAGKNEFALCSLIQRMSHSNQKLNSKLQLELVNFITNHSPNRLSRLIRDLLLEHLLQTNGLYLINDNSVTGLSALFDLLESAQKQRKKWKKKKPQINRG